jgi:hypothetical protein
MAALEHGALPHAVQSGKRQGKPQIRHYIVIILKPSYKPAYSRSRMGMHYNASQMLECIAPMQQPL